ncbi:MAG: LamG-like jellyroll fold domain-containing protein, partial [Nevskiales bacterium]
DKTGNGHDGTLVNVASVAGGEVGQAFSFTGGNSYVSVPSTSSLSLTGDLTIDAWVNPSSYSSFQHIVSKRDSDNQNVSYEVFLFGGGGELSFASKFSGSNTFLQSGFVVPTDTWTHVAVTISGSTLTFYMNGNASAGQSYPYTRPVTSDVLSIGTAIAGGPVESWPGMIDEVEIFDRALSAAEIQAIYEAGSDGKCKNQACATPPPGMVSWFKAENNANDSQGANDGTLENGATFAAGQVGQAFSFDGVDDSVALGNPTNLQLSDAITVDAWIRPDSAAGFKYTIAKWQAGGGGGSSWLLAINGDSPRAFVLGNGGDGFTEVQAGSLPTGPSAPFSHVAMTYSATDALRLYVNGVQVGTGGESVGTMANPTSQAVNLGSASVGGAGEFFAGALDEVEIFNRALTATEIKEIYDAGVNGKCSTCTPLPDNAVAWYRGEGDATDVVGGNNGTLINGATATGDGIVGQAFELNGTGQFVTVAGIPDPNPAYSFDAWVYWEGTVNGSGHDAIVVRNTSANNGSDSYGMFIANADNSLYNTLENQVYSSSAGGVPLNTWFHVAQTYDGATARVYINGQFATSFNQARNVSTGDVGIGARADGVGQHPFNGLIDEVEFFDRALSGAEIEKIYRAGSRGKCPPPDFGDAPSAAQSGFASSYPTLLADNGARHLLSGLLLGAARDPESNGQPNASATGDDLAGDDEDGVSFGTLKRGSSASVAVTASGAGVLDAWLDFNRDGDWNDAGERIFTGQAVVNGVNNLPVAVPLGASAGTSFARFRLSTIGVLAPTGEAPDGEVEDYLVAILPPNIPPTISNITNKTTNEDTPVTVNFTVGDADDGAGALTLIGTSSNQTRVPNANLVFGGNGANRTVTLTPAANQTGTATITITAIDGTGGQASDSFVLTINPINDRPTISNITDRTIPEDGTTGNIAFTLADPDNALNSLQLTVNSSNQTLVPLDLIVLGGSGANRSIR